MVVNVISMVNHQQKMISCPEKEYCAADEYVDCGDTSCQCLPCPDGMTAEAETNQVNGT
eukprot:UN16573